MASGLGNSSLKKNSGQTLDVGKEKGKGTPIIASTDQFPDWKI